MYTSMTHMRVVTACLESLQPFGGALLTVALNDQVSGEPRGVDVWTTPAHIMSGKASPQKAVLHS